MLSLLSSEMFEGILSSSEEITAIFGEPVGTLLNSEAECEKDFEQYNIVDGLHMADFEKDYQDDP